MGMKLKSGADLCGFQLTNFCVQGEASAPSDAALGRKYFHTNATDDVATGISLLHRERIYLGEGVWRATAYLDDIAAINEKLNLITGDTDTDTLINNLKDLEEFLKDFSETDKLKSLLDGKLSTSGGTMVDASSIKWGNNKCSWDGAPEGFICVSNLRNDDSYGYYAGLSFKGYYGLQIRNYAGTENYEIRGYDSNAWGTWRTLIHSGNIGDYALKRVDQVGDLNSVSAGEFFFSKYQAANRPSTNFSGGLTLQVLKSSTEDQRIQLAFGTDYVGYVRGYANGTYTAWKTIAFTDSDITGYSAGLKHSNGTIGAVVNSSGNVTIGASDLAGTSAKLCVEGKMRVTSRLLTGDGDDAGIWRGSHFSSGLAVNDIAIYGENKIVLYGGNVLIGTSSEIKSGVKLQVKGDLYVDGNIIATKEVSAGGAGAEEGTSEGGGSVDFHSEDFTPSTSTTYQVNHNLGKKVIVQVYEQGATSETWNLVMVDVEIISATRLDLRFGKTETTPHRVVVMGAGV